MQNLLAKAVVLAVIAGGFALTGDLGRLASRGHKVLDAADVPLPAQEESPPVGPARLPRPLTEGPAPAPLAAAPREVTAITEAPKGGPDRVDWARLSPGDRIVVWLAPPGPRCLVLDVVDPAAREALAYEVAAVAADGRPLAAATPPRRVVVAGADDGLVTGAPLHLAPAGLAAAGDAGTAHGPVESLAIVH